MTTPTAALQTAAITTLAVASGVTALWLTLGALDSPSAAPSQPPADVRIEYVDEGGNLLPNDIAEEPIVVVVDQFGQPYTPGQEDPTPVVEPPAQVGAVESAYAEPAQYEAAQYEEETYEEGEHYEENEDDD